MTSEPTPKVEDATRLWFTTFPAPARWTTQGKFEAWTWVEVLHHVRTPELWPGAESIEASEAQLPGWTFARFADDCRVASEDASVAARETAARVREVYGIVVEYVDDPAVDVEHVKRWWGRWRYVAYTTAFHQRPHGEKPAGPRWRVMLPFCRPVSLDEAIRIGQWARSPHRDAGIVDAATTEPWRHWAVPSVVPGGFKFDVHRGALLDPDEVLADLEAWRTDDLSQAAHRELDRSAIGVVSLEWLENVRARVPMASWPGFRADAEPAVRNPLLPAPAHAIHAWPRLVGAIGGLWAGRVVALVGPTGSGRSAWLLQVAESSARQGNPVLLAPLRMGSEELVARLLATRAAGSVSFAALVAHPGATLDVELAVRRLATDCPNLYLWSRAHAERTPDALEAVARAMVGAHGGRSPLLVVDGLDLPEQAPEWWDALLDVARPGGLQADWPGAAVIVSCPLPLGAADAFADPRALLAWTEQAMHRATALETLDPALVELADRAGVVLGVTVDPAGTPEARPAAVAVLANRLGSRVAVPYVFHARQGVWEEVGAAAAADETPPITALVKIAS